MTKPNPLICVSWISVLKKLTRVVVAEILSFATVLFALGPQVCLDWTVLTRLQDDTEDLFSRPQSHGLMDAQQGKMLAAGLRDRVTV